jgi:hypothetical protein
MKSKYRIKILFFFLIISLINSTIITEGYHFFDSFYYRDMYKNFLKQRKSNKCSIDEGPNCFFIQNKNGSQIEIELKNIYPENTILINEKPEEIYAKLKNSTNSISEKDTSTIEDEIFEFDSPYVMTLLLSFESYDEKTKQGDIYAPETIDTPFDIGRVTLTIFGKLRLSQKDCEKYHSKIISKQERPQKTYAYVESKEVIIKFNVKSTINSLYIKKNKYNQNNKTFYLYGYKNGNKYLITKIQNVPSTEWIKINGDGKKYESIGLMRGFDYDNIAIMSSMEGLPNYNQLTKQFSSFIKEKIRTTLSEEVDKIKGRKVGRDKAKKGENDGVKIIKIDIDQEDIIKNDKEEDFNLSEEFLNEVENKYKNEKLEHNRNNDIKKDVNNNNNENIKNEDL